MHIAEFEIFAREWETAERSRHACLMEQLKREYRVEPRSPAPIEQAIDLPYSVRLSQQQVRPQGRSRSDRADRPSRIIEERQP